MTTIKDVHAREILDSRGNPTLEVDMLVGNFIARASVPIGASVGKYEAVELRDENKKITVFWSVLDIPHRLSDHA